MKRPLLTAVIFDKRGRILSVGRNSYIKTHPLQAKYAREAGTPDRVYLHAELSALIRCRNPRKAFRILVTRVGRGGETRLAKPCESCMRAIKDFGIKIVEHT